MNRFVFFGVAISFVVTAAITTLVSADEAPKTNANSAETPKPEIRRQREIEILEYLNKQGGFADRYELVRSTDEFAPKKITVLKRPVELALFQKQFGAPETVEKDASAFVPVDVGGMPRISQGERLQYGLLVLFLENAIISQIGEIHVIPNARIKPADSRDRFGEDILPAYETDLDGKNDVRIRNPNPYKVKVGLRQGASGKNFLVPENGIASITAPDGKFDIFFVLSDRPKSLYQGDSFGLNGNDVEIKLVKVVGGNFEIRKVK